MAVSNVTRNLRDGQMTIADGDGASTTLVLDNGDLSWTQPIDEAIQIKDRGVLHHVRKGDQMSIDLSYSVKWVHLIAETVTGSSDDATFYEMVENRNDAYTSVDATTDDKFKLRHTFNIDDPVGANNEQVIFNKVYCVNVNPSEGADTNTISFTGVDYETKPTVTR